MRFIMSSSHFSHCSNVPDAKTLHLTGHTNEDLPQCPLQRDFETSLSSISLYNGDVKENPWSKCVGKQFFPLNINAALLNSWNG